MGSAHERAVFTPCISMRKSEKGNDLIVQQLVLAASMRTAIKFFFSPHEWLGFSAVSWVRNGA